MPLCGSMVNLTTLGIYIVKKQTPCTQSGERLITDRWLSDSIVGHLTETYHSGATPYSLHGVSQIDELSGQITASADQAEQTVAAIGAAQSGAEEVTAIFESVGAEGKASQTQAVKDILETATAQAEALKSTLDEALSMSEALRDG